MLKKYLEIFGVFFCQTNFLLDIPELNAWATNALKDIKNITFLINSICYF